jgi:hypothetical protein
MKKVIFVLTLAAMWSLSGLASADGADGPGVFTMKPIIIVGRPNLPSVVIELTRPTAAQSARAAHEEMRNAMIEKLRPATLSH